MNPKVAGVLSFLLVSGAGFAVFPQFVHAPIEKIAAPLSKPEATIIFGGDMMFDRTVRQAVEKNGEDFLFSCIDDTLRQADLVVANLEGPITSAPSVSLGSATDTPENITFTFPTTTATLLARHHIGIVNIGNNHILNQGVWGLEETRKYLTAAHVDYFGDPEANVEPLVLRKDMQGIPLSFLNWNEWHGTTSDAVLSAVASEKEAGRVVVVYTHWGDEYVPPPKRVRDLAHAFVDAGAEIVIGSHPHVVQEHELYRGKKIYYSLGNFFFDQYWEEAVRSGLLLKVTLTREGVEKITELPILLERDRRTCPVL